MKEKFIKAYMDTAQRFAELSYARRLHVGAIVVKNDRIISIGYNGMPAGWDNDCEDRVYATEWSIDNDIWTHQDETGRPYNLETKPEVLHAERNALDKLAKGTEGGNGADMFITHSPCLECAKSILGAGIKRVWFSEQYRDDSGLTFLEKSGIIVEQVN
jgi:dCMP deaminase